MTNIIHFILNVDFLRYFYIDIECIFLNYREYLDAKANMRVVPNKSINIGSATRRKRQTYSNVNDNYRKNIKNTGKSQNKSSANQSKESKRFYSISYNCIFFKIFYIANNSNVLLGNLNSKRSKV